jgi:hypothetical protein
MAKDNNIVHQYFKKQFPDFKILVKVNPFTFKGTEITVEADNSTSIRELDFDEGIFEDLKADDFTEASPLEFNLYLSRLA